MSTTKYFKADFAGCRSSYGEFSLFYSSDSQVDVEEHIKKGLGSHETLLSLKELDKEPEFTWLSDDKILEV